MGHIATQNADVRMDCVAITLNPVLYILPKIFPQCAGSLHLVQRVQWTLWWPCMTHMMRSVVHTSWWCCVHIYGSGLLIVHQHWYSSDQTPLNTTIGQTQVFDMSICHFMEPTSLTVMKLRRDICLILFGPLLQFHIFLSPISLFIAWWWKMQNSTWSSEGKCTSGAEW